MAKHLVDIDEEALGAARAELGTRTIRDTVNEALSRAAGKRSVEGSLTNEADVARRRAEPADGNQHHRVGDLPEP